MRRTILVLICAGAVLFAAGCGGSGGGSTSNGSRLSESAFRAKANQICTELTSQEQPDLNSGTKAALDRNLARIDSALSKLRALQPPAQDETRYHELLTSFEKADAFVKAHESTLVRLAHAMKAHPNDSHTSAQYQNLVRPFVLASQIAANDANVLGLKACANGFTGGSG